MRLLCVQIMALLCAGVSGNGCNLGLPFELGVSIDASEWVIVDNDIDRIGLRIHDLATSTIEFVPLDSHLPDFSITGSGILAAAGFGNQLSILQLPKGTSLRTGEHRASYVAWSNRGDRLAILRLGRALTLIVLDAELNQLLARDVPLEPSGNKIDISWSPDDSRIALSTIKSAPLTSDGLAAVTDYGVVMTLAGIDGETVPIPYSSAHFVGENLLVGTSHFLSPPPYSSNEGIVVMFSLSGAEVQNVGQIVEAMGVATSLPLLGIFLTEEPPPIFPLPSGTSVFNIQLRIRDVRGARSRQLGAGLFSSTVFKRNTPIGLIPRTSLVGTATLNSSLGSQ